MKSYQWAQTDWKAGPIWTKTSVPTTSEAPPSKLGGFTFLELMVVIALVALLAGYAIPNFTAFFIPPQEKCYRNLVQVMRLLRTDAVLRSQSYCLTFNIKTQEIYASELNSAKCEENRINLNDIKHDQLLPGGILLQEARFASETQGMSPPDAFDVRIDSSGFVTPFLLILAEEEGSRYWEIESKGILGQLVMREL